MQLEQGAGEILRRGLGAGVGVRLKLVTPREIRHARRDEEGELRQRQQEQQVVGTEPGVSQAADEPRERRGLQVEQLQW